MKKWIPALLFMSVCGYNKSSAAAYKATVFVDFRSELAIDGGHVNGIANSVTFGVPFLLAGKTGTVSYQDCGGFDFSYGLFWSEYFAWMVIPKHVKDTDTNSDITISLTNKGSWSLDAEDSDNYYLTIGYGWDEPNTWGYTCYDMGAPANGWSDVMPESHIRNFGNVILKASMPVDLPKGQHNIPINILRGLQRNNYSYMGGRYKIPSYIMKTWPFDSTVNLVVDNSGGCQPSSQSLEINHGSLSTDSAQGHYASKTLSIYCNVAADVKISLISNTPPTYSNQKFSVGLGNGWDSIISLDGIERSEEVLRWSTAGTKTVEIGSKLYGEGKNIKTGKLSGSMTMIMSVP